MSADDQHHAAMMRAQAIEERFVAMLKTHDHTKATLEGQLEAAEAIGQDARLAAADLRVDLGDLNQRLGVSVSQLSSLRETHFKVMRQLDVMAAQLEAKTSAAIRADIHVRAIEQEFEHLVARSSLRNAHIAGSVTMRYSALVQEVQRQARQEDAIYALARWASRIGVLLGLLGRSKHRRIDIITAHATRLDLPLEDIQHFMDWLTRSRVLLGLTRRSWRSREALVGLQLFRVTQRDIDRNLLVNDDIKTDIQPVLQSLSWAWSAHWQRMAAGGQWSANAVYEGVDFESDAVLAWVKNVPSKWPLPEGDDVHRGSIDTLRKTPLFNELSYCAQAGLKVEGQDAIRHYCVIGEAVGLKPSEAFDPRYYANRYVDILQAGMGFLAHYISNGRDEGRNPLPPGRIHSNWMRFDSLRRNVVIVLHETSRSGAPILGWNIACMLAQHYNVFTVLLGGGAITADLQAVSVETHGPFERNDRHRVDLTYALAPLFDGRIFQYAIVNSSESRVFVEIFAQRLIPTLFLMHEFGSYVNPLSELRRAFNWADEIVFPARIVAQSSEGVHPPLLNRRLAILPQGMSELPAEDRSDEPAEASVSELRSIKADGTFLVLGAGSVSLRKGVDLFIAIAAAVRRSDPARGLHFVWIGHGYRPDRDMSYSVYLREQVVRSGLDDSITFLDEVPNLERIYALADAFLLTSRLDPLPNVSIDAAWRGIPIICFEGASGTADLLRQNPITATGVVPHLDVQAASDVLVSLATDHGRLQTLSRATAVLARSVFDMKAYVQGLDALGTGWANFAQQWREDVETISRDEGFDQDFFLGSEVVIEDRDESVRRYVAASNKLDRDSAWQRRPAPGFNARAWQDCHPSASEAAFAGFIRAGKPKGSWQLPVLRGSFTSGCATAPALLHVATNDAAGLVPMIGRLRKNRGPFDLVISTDRSSFVPISQVLRALGCVATVVDGRLGSMSSLLTYLDRQPGDSRYEILGHMSAWADAPLPSWRDFQWETLLGGRYPMADVIVNEFARVSSLGLVFPAEPYLPEWDDATRVRLKTLGAAITGCQSDRASDYDFPEGGMFWARRSVLDSLRRAFPRDRAGQDALTPSDEAFDRLLPLVCQSLGLTQAVTTVAATGW
jgi:glycosyltransferase involved in cell wall biosynthesis